jgi:nucleotide-binding universal stress UspA family protein
MRLLNLKSILVATELEDAALPAVIAASRLADAAGASLHVVSVATSGNQHSGDDPDMPESKEALAAILERAGAPEKSKSYLLNGDAAFEISALARRVHADAVVLGPHRERKADARALGSTALAVVTNASSPCMVVSTPLRLPLRRVLVPIDLSDTARGALLVGLSWASALRGGARENPNHTDVDLTVLYVRKGSRDDAPSPPQALERELEHMRKASGTWAGVSVKAETIVGADATQGIVDYVGKNEWDLVVMGTRGLGLDPVGRLGSVADSVTRVIDPPVLLVPPAVWQEHTRVSGVTSRS